MIVVMGAAGNTGKSVAGHLLAAGEKVRVIGRSRRVSRRRTGTAEAPARSVGEGVKVSPGWD